MSGSAHGGTLLTVTGFGFGNSKDDVAVDIAGIPCEVVTCSNSEIKCWMGAPAPGSDIVASVVGGASNFTGVESGFRFKGMLQCNMRNVGNNCLLFCVPVCLFVCYCVVNISRVSGVRYCIKIHFMQICLS